MPRLRYRHGLIFWQALASYLFQLSVYGIQVFGQSSVSCVGIVPAVQGLVALVAGNLLPYPGLFFLRVILKAFREQARKIAGAVIVPLGKMAEF